MSFITAPHYTYPLLLELLVSIMIINPALLLDQ
jgi:hypothetical protein